MRHLRAVARFGTSPDSPWGALALPLRHWALLAVCASFLLAGALVLDDYGIGTDANAQIRIGRAVLDRLAGGGEQALDHLYRDWDQYYGGVFEAPLALVERIPGLDDSRNYFLTRHLLTHLFFLAGGVFSYLLVLRMFGNRLLALAAMALFLLHPRLYAHSFFNSKDIPFAAMFMIALYLTHRAFRRDTVAAFLLCGVGVGVLVNLRIMGLVLFAAVLALRGLDLLVAGGMGERKRILLAGGAFALVGALTYYALSPVLWVDPFGRFGETWAFSAGHGNPASNLFRGEWLWAPDGAPFEYIPVWMGITTPPVALLLAVVGAAGLCRGAARRPRDLWRATPLRFNLLLLLLIVIPIVAIFAGRNNIYNGWRQVYFLYAPLAILAMVGFHWLLASIDRRWWRVGAWSLMGASVAVTLVSMVRIHPLQFDYFNSIVDRNRQDWLARHYELDHWAMSTMTIIEEVLADHPDQKILLPGSDYRHSRIFTREERERIYKEYNHPLDGFLSDRSIKVRNYEVKIYNNTVHRLTGMNPDLQKLTAILDRASGNFLASSVFDIYRDGDALVYVREGCTEEEADAAFALHIFPVRVDDLPADRRRYGLDKRDFELWQRGGVHDGRCVAVVALPDYLIASVYTGQSDETGWLWGMSFLVTPPQVDAAVLARAPLASSVFDIYRDGDALVYVRERCTEDEVRVRFFLHVVPVDAADLPADRVRYGFDNRDFQFWQRGGRHDGRCVAVVALPDYPIASVYTGQSDETGRLWQVRFGVMLPEVDEAVLAGGPVASSTFDVYRDGAGLVYVKDPCTEEDIETALALNVYPLDPADLPADRKRDGFNHQIFRFWDHGARVGERCVAVVPLPGYPVVAVQIGQLDATGWLWEVSFGVTPPRVDAAVLAGGPLASSTFDVYRDGDALAYVRDGCTEDEAARFFLHIVPVDVEDLPADRVQYGFDNRDFHFWQRGGMHDGRCVAVVALPDYPIARVYTGQSDETGRLWTVDFALTDEE